MNIYFFITFILLANVKNTLLNCSQYIMFNSCLQYFSFDYLNHFLLNRSYTWSFIFFQQIVHHFNISYFAEILFVLFKHFYFKILYAVYLQNVHLIKISNYFMFFLIFKFIYYQFIYFEKPLSWDKSLISKLAYKLSWKSDEYKIKM